MAPSAAAVSALVAAGVRRVQRWGRGVDAALFAPVRRDPALRARLVPRGELIVGHVGRLAPEKNVERLAALDDLPGVRVVVVGDGPERSHLQRGLPQAVFLGMLTGDELARAYASFDVFAHTGPFETFGQVVQVAMASGVPVVAPNVGGPSELVGHGRTGYLVPPGVLDAMRAAVVALRDDSVLRLAFGHAARRAVAGRSWFAVCEELVGNYRGAPARSGVTCASCKWPTSTSPRSPRRSGTPGAAVICRRSDAVGCALWSAVPGEAHGAQRWRRSPAAIVSGVNSRRVVHHPV